VRVLLVDDDPVSLKQMARVLRKLGCRVVTAHDGASACDKFFREPFPVVITNWEMPGIDGLEFCRRVRKASLPAYSYLLVLSVRNTLQDQLGVLLAGADTLVSKPAGIEERTVHMQAAERILKIEQDFGESNRELLAMNQRLLRMSRLDPLMEIGNRLALEEEFTPFHRLAAERDLCYGIVMCDIDRFKSCNDRFGHQQGDEILRKVAAAIRSALRASDRAFRYGGEEVLILLSQQNLKGTRAAAERIRKRVENLRIRLPGVKELVRVTISCGVASYPENFNQRLGWAELLKCADDALYRAKAAGRNCVVMAGAGDRPRARSGAGGLETLSKAVEQRGRRVRAQVPLH